MNGQAARLNEAFSTFAAASGALERSWNRLCDTVRELKVELEERNAALARALKEAQDAREFMRCVLESMEDAVLVLDPGDRIAMANPAAARLLGLEQEAMVGRRFGDLGAAIRTEGPRQVLEAGGRRCDVMVSRAPVRDGAGRPRGGVILIRDVTRQRELEAHYARNRRLILMGEMAAKIVHEIRSPLCSIELYAGMLEAEAAGRISPGLVSGIVTGIRGLNTILTNMLYFARNPTPRFASVDAGAAVDAAVGLLGAAVEARRIVLRRECPAGLLLRADPELLRQALLNLLLNAIQAAGEGGRVDVVARLEEAGPVVAVEDDGPGVPPEDRERIFDPFFTTRENGTGLGLAIVARIMEAHGGYVTVGTSPAGGAAFALRFPAWLPGGAREGDPG